MKRLAVAVCCAMLTFAAPASAAVIDFEGRGGYFGFSVPFGDYRIQATSASFQVGNSSGTYALFPTPNAGPVTLSRLDGTAFTLSAADFFAGDSNGLGVPITFTFTRADGSTGSYTLQTPEFGPGAAIPSTRFAADFGTNLAGITRVSWSNGAEWHQIDNIVVDAAAAPVPEPSTWALLILGFAALGAVLRTRHYYTGYRA